MPVPLVIVVTGAPCTGKTTLSRRLAAEFALPVVSKDGIKELLFDVLGWSDRAWSGKLGTASVRLLYYFIERQLAAGKSLIAESDFYREYAPADFAGLAARYSFRILQIVCRTDPQVLADRMVARARLPERHPGHHERGMTDEAIRGGMLATVARGSWEAIPLDGPVIEVDTTDFATVDYAAVIDEVRAALQRSRESL